MFLLFYFIEVYFQNHFKRLFCLYFYIYTFENDVVIIGIGINIFGAYDIFAGFAINRKCIPVYFVSMTDYEITVFISNEYRYSG